MMNILFLVNTPSPYRVDFFNELGKRCNLTVLFETRSARSRDAKWVAENFSNFRPEFLKGIRVGEAEAICPEVIRYLSQKKYDVIIVGMYSSPTGMIAIEYMNLKKIPFILSSDGGMIRRENNLNKFVKRHLISSASAWLSTGDMTTEYFCYYGACKEKIYKYSFTSMKSEDVLKQPMTENEKKRFKRELNILEKKMVIAVGQFVYRKGFDILIKACENLSSNIGVYIVGGKETPEYTELIYEKQIKNIHFVEFKAKEILMEYYRAADVFVLPTREDIWGLVINEAMAFGLPVVTTDKCGAGLEMIQNQRNGVLIPAEDSTALAEAIDEAFAIDSQEVLNTAKKYTIENMAAEHMRIFNEFIENVD